MSASAAHQRNLWLQADEADNPSVRFLLVLVIPVMLFSAWQFVRREENENRLALVASEVALRDVDVSCPGFWARLVEITPNAGWVDFDEHGRPSDKTSLSATTCRGLERVWRREQTSFTCLIGGGCDALIPDRPPKAALDFRRKKANQALRKKSKTTPKKPEAAAGYRPHRKTAKRRSKG